ncbi:MAG TPA: glycine cleavage system protein H [Clostridia bacterium]|nr:glycine cleavage system protein H [Clostridia bacterium]
MSILFVLLTFLLVISITYFRRGTGNVAVQVKEPNAWARPAAPRISKEQGFDIPKGYCFHPGHTWVLDEGRQNARIGIDSFASSLIGKIERIEVVGLNRWVRQGQKLMSITTEGLTVDLLSPIEGVITSVNHEAIKNPELTTKDPYRDGWICVVKSPELSTNLKNLVTGTLVAPWMQNSLGHVRSLAQTLAPALAQDGGMPVSGLLAQLDPGSQRKLIHEFFLT